MKTYHLRLTQSDFTKIGDVWRSSVIDLYYNTHYKNYTTIKSNYGTNLLGNGVYTGLNSNDGIHSEIGFIESGRFIDTSSRVDINSWQLNYLNQTDASINAILSTYTSTNSSSTPAYLGDWSITNNILPGAPIYAVNANRYAYFEITLTSDADLTSLQFEVFFVIEIDPPAINGYFTGTRSLQNKFPEWMALREYDPSDPLGAKPATPSTVGGSLLNAVAGEWITDITSKLQYQQYQLYISSVDVGQKDWVYSTANLPQYVYSIKGDGIELSRAATIEEYHQSLYTEDICLWNQVTRELYVNKNYNQLLINGGNFELNPYHIWNSVDDIGVTVDIFRLPLEGNQSLKNRIIDVYRNPLSVSLDGFKLALRRELNLWKYWGATPNSDYQGATPNVYEMSDIENQPEYFTADGLPTTKFLELATELAERYPVTWGYFLWNEAYYDPDGIQHKGFSNIPRQLDATPVTETYLESGVGDGNDLYMFKPQSYTGLNQFTGKLKIRGRQKTTRSEYIPLRFNVRVYGTASESAYINPVVTGNFTIEVTVSGIVYYCPITLVTQNNTTYYATPNTSSWALLEWTTPDGYTDIAFPFRNYLTNALFTSGAATPSGQINLHNVSKIEVKKGWYGGPSATPSYTDLPTDSQYKLWYIQTPGTFLGSGSVTTSLVLNAFNYLLTNPSLRMQSQILNYFAATPNTPTAATPNTWISDSYYYDISLNGKPPTMDQQNFTLQLPNIVWPASTTNRQYIVELTTFNGTVYGAYSDAVAATPIFIPGTQITMNGSNAWAFGGKAQSVPFLSTSVVFASSYSIPSPVWSLFEASQINQFPSGSVDENGPYVGGLPAPKANSNFLLNNYNLTRDDFGIPNTTDYIITWMGVDSVSNANVLLWMSTNSVLPAIKDIAETGLIINYPADTIVETLNTTTNKYQFSTVGLFAKLKPGVNDRWVPKLYSGYFYDDVDEYYLYANPAIESATASSKVLSGLNRQGAPIIVTAGNKELRQVSFYDLPATPDYATPISQTLTNIQTLSGNGTNTLYIAYKDVYNISVKDITVGFPVSTIGTSTTTNQIQLATPTNPNHTYTVTYTPTFSYYVDNEAIDAATGLPKSKLVFDKTPASVGVGSYTINYESSIYDPATPVNVPLNPFHTSITDGFVFIDHDVRPLNQLEVKISPSTLVADGTDYALVTFRSYDNVGNPKPFQTFNIFTNWGAFDKSTVRTDRDGFTSAILTSKVWNGGINQATPATPNALAAATPGSATQGLILAATPGMSAKAGFQIQLLPPTTGRVVASMDSASIVSDGKSATAIFGIVENANHVPMAGIKVFWNKGRTIYELFKNRIFNNSSATPGSTGLSGSVTTDSRGRFVINPFVSNITPGYWFVSAEATIPATPSGTDLQGDVVYWYEYPNVTNGIDTVSNNIVYPIQTATPSWTIPQYTLGSAFPTSYDESIPQAGMTVPVISWTPPKWYAIDKYKQYQMGLYGTSYNISGATPSFPDYKEL